MLEKILNNWKVFATLSVLNIPCIPLNLSNDYYGLAAWSLFNVVFCGYLAYRKYKR